MTRRNVVITASLLCLVMSAAVHAETKSVGGSTRCQRDSTQPGCETPVAGTTHSPTAGNAMPRYEGTCVWDRTRPSCENRQASSIVVARPASNDLRGNAAVGGVAVGFLAGASYGVYFCIPTMWVPGAYGACLGASALIGTALGGATGAVVELDKATRTNPPAKP